jgi:hypothetical protein
MLVFSLLCFSIILSPSVLWSDEKPAEDILSSVDAFQAMQIANEWNWSNKEIKSSVYPHVIVFKLPNGRITRIPLPKNQMVVAVAPYINSTHK